MRIQQEFLAALFAASILVVAGCPAKDASSGSDAGPAGDADSATDGSSRADGDASQEPACWMHTVVHARALLSGGPRELGNGQMEWKFSFDAPAYLDGTTELQNISGSDHGYASIRTDANGAVLSAKSIAKTSPTWGPSRVLGNGAGVVSIMRGDASTDASGGDGGEAVHSVVDAVMYQVGGSSVVWKSVLFGSMDQKPPYTNTQIMSDGRIAISAWAEPDHPLFVHRADGSVVRVADKAAVVSTVLPDGNIGHTWILPITEWPAAKGGWAGTPLTYPKHQDFYWTGVFVIPSADGGAIGTVNGRLVRFSPDGTTGPFSADAGGTYESKQPWKRLAWEPGEQTLLVWRLDKGFQGITVSATRFDQDGHVVQTGFAKGVADFSCVRIVDFNPEVSSSGEVFLTLENSGAPFDFGNGVRLGGAAGCDDDSRSEPMHVGFAKFDSTGKPLEGVNLPNWLHMRVVKTDLDGGPYFTGWATPSSANLPQGTVYSAGCGPLPEEPSMFIMHFRSGQWPDLGVSQ